AARDACGVGEDVPGGEVVRFLLAAGRATGRRVRKAVQLVDAAARARAPDDAGADIARARAVRSRPARVRRVALVVRAVPVVEEDARVAGEGRAARAVSVGADRRDRHPHLLLREEALV